MLYLGIDQHRKQLTVNLRNEQGDVELKRQVSTEWDRGRDFFSKLRDRAEPEGEFVAVVEVCGFNDWLLKMLAEYECREIVLIQPEKRSSKKTDSRDADTLSQTLWVNRQRLLSGKKMHGLKRIVPATPEDDENRQLTALRQRMGVLRTRTINKAHHILLKHNLQQECPTKGFQTKKARRWMAKLPLSEIDRMEMDMLLAQWDLWEEQLKQLQEKIEERQKTNHAATVVATMPGAGAYGSLALASRIGDVERFPRPDSLAIERDLGPGRMGADVEPGGGRGRSFARVGSPPMRTVSASSAVFMRSASAH